MPNPLSLICSLLFCFLAWAWPLVPAAATAPPALDREAPPATDSRAAEAETTRAPVSAADAGADAAVAAAAAQRDAADNQLSRQLARQLHGVDGLEGVTVTVQGGVARLDGEVIEVANRALAEQIASQQAGVGAVDNRVELSTRLSVRLQTAMRQATDKLVRLVAAIPLLLVAVLVVLLAWRLGHMLGNRVGARQLRSDNPYMASLLQRVVQWATLLAGLVIALDLLGATALVGAVLGSAGVVGLVVGFAFKDIAENYVAGILLSLRRPFAPGDHLRIDNFEGRVAALTSRSTIMVTPDGNRLTLPNALVFKSVVMNFTRNPKRRFDFSIPIDASESIRDAQQLALGKISAIDGVLDDPGPSWTVQGYDSVGITLQFFGWVDQRQSDLGKVRSESIRAVKDALAGAGISAPRSIQYVAALPAEAATLPPQATVVPDDRIQGDTSVNRDIDEQVAAEQRAHSADDLIGSPER